jgi:hypothetical protein
MEDVKNTIDTLCEEHEYYCGVILNHEALLEVIKLALNTGESIKIPYRDPLTGRSTIYVPDFFIVYQDKNGSKHAEVVEVKPSNHTFREAVGKSQYNQQQYVKNMAKWEAANAWCKQQNIKFRVINETDIFHQGTKRR